MPRERTVEDLKREMAGADPDQTAETCTCGRPVRRLNYASDQARCICGYAPDLCRCQPITEGSNPS